MTQTMKAAVAHAFGEPLRIEEVKVPLPGPGQILVKIEACGVCHTDLHAVEGDWPVRPSLPFIPGHEGVGYVAAVGSGVTRVKEGDRVGVPWLYSACGCCEHCLTGWETLCAAQQNTGYSVNGATPSTCWPTPTTSASCPRRWRSTRSRRSSAPGSRCTRA
ncbi:alcohol dehydrogenase [Pseudomonas sp. BAY1663]|nr:alcohol dehydrogenase [Pseudomonas sp. BAY1663]